MLRKKLFLVSTAALLAAVFVPSPASAGFCWGYSGNAATNPLPWDDSCDSLNGLHPPGSVVGQNIRDEHRNWHCQNPLVGSNAYGRAFLAFHRQFILDFNNWRLDNLPALGRLEIWDPFQGALVPGNDETTSSSYTHCSSCLPGVCGAGSPFLRPAGATCPGCSDLPATYIGANLDDFDSLGELGFSIDIDWHASYHGGVSSISPGCGDIGGTTNTSRDPAFWMAHGKLDEVSRAWQARQATDVVIVIDRSGSMDDNCSSTNPPPGETPCAINDAKTAALVFADLVQDVRLDGGIPAPDQHRIGLVSYSSSSSADVGLSPAAGIVDDMAITPFEAGVAGISTGGGTSIAAGIREAIIMLTGVATPNKHQTILVLTDGKENVGPCLEGATSPCVSADVLTAAELNNIQIVAIGLGDGAEEDALRDVTERHGGIFIAQQNLVNAADNLDPLRLQKFFVTAGGQIFDEVIAEDPYRMFPAGAATDKPFSISICGAEQRATFVLGHDVADYKRDTNEVRDRSCEFDLKIVSPAGLVVDLSDTRAVEVGRGPTHSFVRLRLPYKGESKGVWQAIPTRVVGKAKKCGEQRYFYSTQTAGLGKVTPFSVRPRVVVGTPLLSTFRLGFPSRPKGGWDEVEAQVVITDPNGKTDEFQLFDDGTHGDKIIGNNIWSVEVPYKTTTVGAHHMRARFWLTENGCTVVREAEYAVIVKPEPKDCGKLACGKTLYAHAGDVLNLEELSCVQNVCGPDYNFAMKVTDSHKWLRLLDKNGNVTSKLPGVLKGNAVTNSLTCIGEGLPGMALVIPADAKPGTKIRLNTVVGSDRSESDCASIVTILDPPDCNGNGVVDSKDIASGKSADKNGNGVPDECERLGACCAEEGCFVDTTERHCLSKRGKWHKALTCGEAPCETSMRKKTSAPPACCTKADGCWDEVSGTQCTRQAGTFCTTATCMREFTAVTGCTASPPWALAPILALALLGTFWSRRRRS